MLSAGLRTGASAHLDYVSPPRSSNRACGFLARDTYSTSCIRSREVELPQTQAFQAVVHPQLLPREAHGPPGQHLVLPTIVSNGAPGWKSRPRRKGRRRPRPNRTFHLCSNRPSPTEGKRRFDLVCSVAPTAAALPQTT